MAWDFKTDEKCRAPRFFGWRCTRGYHAEGPCAAEPKWWNLRGWHWYWRSTL
jgi:hypothetical protein